MGPLGKAPVLLVADRAAWRRITWLALMSSVIMASAPVTSLLVLTNCCSPVAPHLCVRRSIHLVAQQGSRVVSSALPQELLAIFGSDGIESRKTIQRTWKK